LAAPHETLAVAQEWILSSILSKVPTHDAAHGFVPGRSTVTNAAPHVGKAIVLNSDLTDFFPTVSVWRVNGIFRELGYSPAVATILALLCTESPRRRIEYAGKSLWVATGPRALPQGACTSPALSNLAARRLDSRLIGIARRLGWTYTRYADDLTFSSSEEPAQKIGYLMARIRHIADDEGFKVNEAKTRVLRRGSAQAVTGLVVNDKLGIGRDEVRRLRAILHRARTEGLAAQNREKHPHFVAQVRGMIAYLHMVDPAKAAPLREALAAVSQGE
jgi:retron-type reverse transcriptase